MINRTVFKDTDLTGASGLSSIRHLGPSTIDERTLAKSGELPVTFLRRAGLPNRPGEGATGVIESTHLPSREITQVSYTLFVGARRLDMFFGILPASHLSLVVREEDGTEHEYEGHPERSVMGAYGRIIVSKRPLSPTAGAAEHQIPPALGQVGI